MSDTGKSFGSDAGAADEVDRAIAYVAILDAQFVARIRGADLAVIDEVALVQGRPLATAHRRFLERMGTSTGGLDVGKFDTSAGGLVSALEMTYGDPPAGFELFAVGIDEPFQDLYLVDRRGGSAIELLNSRAGTTYATLAHDVGTVQAVSIAQFIAMSALRQHFVDVAPYRCLLVSRAGSRESLGDRESTAAQSALGVLETFARRLGLMQLWFSSRMTKAFCASVGETKLLCVAVVARQLPGGETLIDVAANQSDLFASIAEALNSMPDIATVARDAAR
jgi:hypothetical protein